MLESLLTYQINKFLEERMKAQAMRFKRSILVFFIFAVLFGGIQIADEGVVSTQGYVDDIHDICLILSTNIYTEEVDWNAFRSCVVTALIN